MIKRAAILVFVVSSLILSGCAEMATKRDSYPGMYNDNKPVSLIVVPAINETTAADAGDLLNVTVAQPFADHGYYVMPMPLVNEIFRQEGILEGSQVKGIPAKVFKENFGADAVLYLTINSWEKSYIVIGGNVSVGIEYVLISTQTNEVLWSYQQMVVIDTGSSSGNILVDIVATAIKTAVTDYVPIAAQVHNRAVMAMPFGGYHPRSGLDGEIKSVNVSAKNGAVEENIN